MKTVLLIIFAVYAVISGILYFKISIKQSHIKVKNVPYYIMQTIKFVVFMFWGWLLYPIALIKQRIIKKAIENNDQETLNKFLD